MDELEVILTEIFKCNRTDLYLKTTANVFTDRELNRLDKILKYRAEAEPLQYILGSTEFMGLQFRIKKGALIPRPETEILVEALIEKTKNIKTQNKKLKILDIGTGSGCIAVSLAKILQNIEITAMDISKEALNLAKENARLHKVEGSIRFLQADIFDSSFFKTNIKFDIIVSNPPYVPTGEIGIFDETTLKEPKIALDGGRDGLDFYRRISKEADKFLGTGGFLILELGYGQADSIRKMFSGKWDIEVFRKDYQGMERVAIIRKKVL